MPACRTNFLGPWNHGGYLGLRFNDAHGESHYGWPQFHLTGVWERSGGVMVLDSYAYETVGNKAIQIAPEPGTLGLLALASLGIAAWRRTKQRVANSEGE